MKGASASTLVSGRAAEGDEEFEGEVAGETGKTGKQEGHDAPATETVRLGTACTRLVRAIILAVLVLEAVVEDGLNQTHATEALNGHRAITALLPLAAIPASTLATVPADDRSLALLWSLFWV